MTELRWFKFVTLLVVELKKMESDGETKYGTFYVSLKAEIIINESDVDTVFELIYSTIISNIQKSPGKGLGWIIDSVVDHTINISKYKPLSGGSYIKLLKELDHPKKVLLIFKILIILNALNSVWSDTYILQIIIQ